MGCNKQSYAFIDASVNSFNSGYYSDDVDTIKPLHDLETKQRWCPSGDCPFTSRLFGDSSKKSKHP